ncbi:MAG: ATP-binding protein [Deltaproteobacteria bacterium]
MEGNQKHIRKAILLGDDLTRAEDLRKALGSEFHVRVVPNWAEILGQCDVDPPDLIIAETSDRRATGICSSLRHDRYLRSVPIVLISDDEAVQIEGLEAGAVDCLDRRIGSDLLKRKLHRIIGLRAAEERLRQSEQKATEKVQELESIIEMVTHDLKSPVVAIGGLVRLLQKRFRTKLSEVGLEEVLDHLSTACDSIGAFLKDLSECLVAEKAELEWSPLRLDRTVVDVVRQYRQLIDERRIRLQLNFGTSRPSVMGDRHKIMQVVDNLLVNAIRHMGNTPEPIICIELRESENYVIAEISDNGVGIPAEYRDKIFKRFFRVPRSGSIPGSGLGLSIAKTIVESHGGLIWLDSGARQGATFVFTLPKSLPAKAHHAYGEMNP